MQEGLFSRVDAFYAQTTAWTSCINDTNDSYLILQPSLRHKEQNLRTVWFRRVEEGRACLGICREMHTSLATLHWSHESNIRVAKMSSGNWACKFDSKQRLRRRATGVQALPKRILHPGSTQVSTLQFHYFMSKSQLWFVINIDSSS